MCWGVGGLARKRISDRLVRFPATRGTKVQRTLVLHEPCCVQDFIIEISARCKCTLLSCLTSYYSNSYKFLDCNARSKLFLFLEILRDLDRYDPNTKKISLLSLRSVLRNHWPGSCPSKNSPDHHENVGANILEEFPKYRRTTNGKIEILSY